MAKQKSAFTCNCTKP